MRGTTITLLSGKDNIVTEQNLVGLLYECAPDSKAFQCGNRVIPLATLIGDFAKTKRKAFDLARKLLDHEPRFRGIQQLGIFEELVIRELQHAFHAIRLHQSLEALGVDICRISSRTRTIDAVRRIQDLAPCSYRLKERFRPATIGGLVARASRVIIRLREAGFSAAGVWAEWRQFLNVVDPYHWRAMFSSKAETPMKRGGIWFYSTSYSFTRIGMMYEPFSPEQFTYLVEDAHTGGRALREARRKFIDLYALGNIALRPPTKELEESRQGIIHHIEAVEVINDDSKLARTLFLNSVFFREFLHVHLSKGLYFSALFESLLNTWKPRAIVVGNPVFEGYLLQQAKTHRIPTILLQHGVLGDYCQLTDPPVDHYIVRGSFWREFLAESTRARSQILNPPKTRAQEALPENKLKHILFLTAPYSTQEFFNQLDLDEILGVLLKVALTREFPLVVRVHPMERIDQYKSRVAKLTDGIGAEVDVEFSYGPGLDEAVRNACVAVSYSSTVFLDCLRYRVPIVSFGWHDFSYKQQLEKHRVFHFAQTLAELETLIGKAIEGVLPPYSESIEPFLAESMETTLRELFSRICVGNNPPSFGVTEI